MSKIIISDRIFGMFDQVPECKRLCNITKGRSETTKRMFVGRSKN
jgi:hypothetical protein